MQLIGFIAERKVIIFLYLLIVRAFVTLAISIPRTSFKLLLGTKSCLVANPGCWFESCGTSTATGYDIWIRSESTANRTLTVLGLISSRISCQRQRRYYCATPSHQQDVIYIVLCYSSRWMLPSQRHLSTILRCKIRSVLWLAMVFIFIIGLVNVRRWVSTLMWRDWWAWNILRTRHLMKSCYRTRLLE